MEYFIHIRKSLSSFAISFQSYCCFSFQAHTIRQNALEEKRQQTSSPTPDWVRKWVKKQAKFKAIYPSTMEIGKIQASCRENLLPFFRKLYHLIKQGKYLQRNIYNLDETSLKYSQALKAKIISTPDSPVALKSPNEFQMRGTIVLCASATGAAAKPALILQEKFPSEILMTGENNFSIESSPKGWITKNIFTKIMKETIIPFISKRLQETQTSEMSESPILPSLCPPTASDYEKDKLSHTTLQSPPETLPKEILTRFRFTPIISIFLSFPS